MISSMLNGHGENRSKQKGPLDVALLCSKLESYKIEQDLAHARRKTRKASSKRKSAPRTAETNLPDETAPPRRPLSVSRMGDRASTTLESEMQLESQVSYAPLEINFGDDPLVLLPEREDDDVGSAEKCDSFHTSSVQRERSPGLRRPHHARTKSGSRVRQPNGAEKRRFSVACTPGEQASRVHAKYEQPSTLIDGQDHWHRRRHGAGVGRKAPIFEEAGEGRSETDLSKLRLPDYTRHNWSQASQNGEVTTGFWTSKPRVGRKAEPKKSPLKVDENARRSSGPKSGGAATERSTQQEDHLINDAVNRMKERERAKRKTSLLGLFKKS